MSLVAANHCLGVLVIDEIQRLSQVRSGGAERMLNFFVQLVNTIGVPVVLIGTYKALVLLNGEFSQMRRGTGQGDLIWDRMAQDDQWQLFTESLWRFQYTRKRRGLNEYPALGAALYDETQGITDFAVKLYMFAQQRAIESGKEEITAAVIRSAARDKLRLPKPVLDALRVGDKRVLERFEDVYPAMLQNSLSSPIGTAPITNRHLSTTGNKSSSCGADELKAEVQPKDSPPMPGQSNETSPGAMAAARHDNGHKMENERVKIDKAPDDGARPLPTLMAAMNRKPNLTVYDILKKRAIFAQ
jgi:AAA domain-containing protein